MTIIAELKRRNVVRVAAYYLAISWLVLQIADVLASVLLLPDWTGRLIFLLLVIGLPIALLLAWAFELSPEGLRRETQSDVGQTAPVGARKKSDYVLIGVIVIALAGFGWNQIQKRERSRSGFLRRRYARRFDNPVIEDQFLAHHFPDDGHALRRFGQAAAGNRA